MVPPRRKRVLRHPRSPLGFHAARIQAGQVQDAVQQLLEHFPSFQHGLPQRALFRAHGRIPQKTGHPQDGGHGCPDFMADARKEFAFCLTGRLCIQHRAYHALLIPLSFRDVIMNAHRSDDVPIRVVDRNTADQQPFELLAWSGSGSHTDCCPRRSGMQLQHPCWPEPLHPTAGPMPCFRSALLHCNRQSRKPRVGAYHPFLAVDLHDAELHVFDDAAVASLCIAHGFDLGLQSWMRRSRSSSWMNWAGIGCNNS